MPYLIQAAEQELSFELMDQLAKVIAEAPGLLHADGMYQLHHARGLLEVSDRKEADRLSSRFAALGYSNFVVDTLLDVPHPEDLHLEHPAIDQAVELLVAARLEVVTERDQPSSDWLRMQVAYTRIPTSEAAAQEHTIEEGDMRYYLDLLTRTRRWRTEHDSLVPIQHYLSQTRFPGASLSSGAQELLAGKRELPRFATEADYERYVTWLYQVKYAPR